MSKERTYWLLTLARGFTAILTGCGIFALPEIARAILLLPISVGLFAVYGVVDGALLIGASYATTVSAMKSSHCAHGLASMTMGVLLLSFLFEHADLKWFLSLAALQAAISACTEAILVKHARTRKIRSWDCTAAFIAGLFALAYVYVRLSLSHALTYQQVAWIVYAFLIAFGMAQCVNAARMLFQDSGDKRSFIDRPL